MAKRGIEHNRLLLCYNMMRGGMSVFDAWKAAGLKIKRSKAQLNRRKRFGDG
jgi:hypothetical protein